MVQALVIESRGFLAHLHICRHDRFGTMGKVFVTTGELPQET